MIIERIPEIGALSEDEKFTLVHELVSELSDQSNDAPDPAIAALLEKRLREYEANPEAVLTWEEVKARLLNRPNG
jgi:putative addiction module component (TIGR02574 family)